MSVVFLTHPRLTIHFSIYTNIADDYTTASHYSYDPHGNVVETLQDVPLMKPVEQDIKSTQYDYDLISGNMNKVEYQKGEIDGFTHMYYYDELNRLKEVQTSTDNQVHISTDAKYQYYDYGPLARVETGEYQVQGTDYAYTINGWLKGANSNTLDPNRDMGKDGTKGYYANNLAVHRHFAKDAFGFTLNYFEGDYRAIGTNKFEAHYSNTPFGNASANLYNGNIRHMVTAIEGMEIQGYAYAYDQLQRLNTMKVFKSEYLIEDNDWRGAKLTDDYFTRINYDKNGNILTLQRNGYKGAQLEMDRFEYFYETIGGNPSNRLNGVKDSAPNYAGYDDIKGGSGYKYNRLGELVYDDTEAMKLEWRYGDHKLKNIERLDQNSPNVEFIYNPLGVRVAKIIKPRSGGVVLEVEKWKVTYYSYDANGQLMATYNSDLYNGTIKETKLEEQYIYGSKRVGVIKANKVLYDGGPVQASISPIKDNFLGKKRYELTNHLGNVLATISDRKIYNSTDGYYEPVITMKADYYAFGMLMPNRFEGIDESRHLFNGMEHDMEVSGEGNSYTTEFRQYDPRLGRWKSLDPLMSSFPNISPYVGFSNNPVVFTDPYGLAPTNGDPVPPNKGSKFWSGLSATTVGALLGSFFDSEVGFVWALNDWVSGEHHYNDWVATISLSVGGITGTMGFFVAGPAGMAIGAAIGTATAVLVQKTIGVIHNMVINYRIKKNQKEWDQLNNSLKEINQKILDKKEIIEEVISDFDFGASWDDQSRQLKFKYHQSNDRLNDLKEEKKSLLEVKNSSGKESFDYASAEYKLRHVEEQMNVYEVKVNIIKNAFEAMDQMHNLKRESVKINNRKESIKRPRPSFGE